MKTLPLAISLLQLLLLWTPAAIGASWPHIYSREHFLDVLGYPGDRGTAGMSGALILYGPDCAALLDAVAMPTTGHNILLTHDYVRSAQHTWYKYRAEDDLRSKYATPESPCLTAYYFRKDRSLDTPTDVWPGVGSLQAWVWSMLRRSVTVVNASPDKITVYQQPTVGKSPPIAKNKYLWPGERIEVETYLSYLLKISDESLARTYYVGVVSENVCNSEIRVIGKESDVDEEKVRADEEAESNFIQEWVYSHSDRILKNLKKPFIVPNYTDTGYKKINIPTDLYKYMVKKYEENKHERYQEKSLKSTDSVTRYPFIENMPTLVHYSYEDIQKIQKEFHPILEDWCQCKLEFKFLYGTREYYEGTVVHNHLDRIETHVISVILQIDQDKDGKEDWELELIDYNGDRKHIILQPGEGLLYEGAKLIHGRPKPFQGKIYANAYLHFAPVGWDYYFDYDQKEFICPSRQLRESQQNLYTELLFNNKNILYVKQEQVKDEL